MHNPKTTRVRMHDSGLFGQDPAFWCWICTREAVRYIVAFGYSSHQEGTPRLLDPNHLAQLAKRIEAEYGCKPYSARHVR